MNPRRTCRLAACLAAGCGAAFAPARAAEKAVAANPYQSLLDNSPFLTPAFKARLGQRDTVALSLVGYTRIGGEWLFAILDRKTGKSRWLKLNEEKDGVKIERFDAATAAIHLTVGGIGFDLGLEKEK